nr:unnamed protein product [Digitaria exilis]
MSRLGLLMWQNPVAGDRNRHAVLYRRWHCFGPWEPSLSLDQSALLIRGDIFLELGRFSPFGSAVSQPPASPPPHHLIARSRRLPPRPLSRRHRLGDLITPSDTSRIVARPPSPRFDLVWFGLASQGEIWGRDQGTGEASGMPGGEDVRKVSRQDIQLLLGSASCREVEIGYAGSLLHFKQKVLMKKTSLQVQNLIERCLQLYMNQKEVVDTLSLQAKIEPSFTELVSLHFWFIYSSFFSPVWQKLEEENREFFKAYYVRLMLMSQITAFNKLLEQQYQIMSKDHPSGVPSMPPAANGSNSSTLNQNVPFLPDTIPSTAMQDSLLHNGGSSGIVNGATSNDQFIYTGKVVHGLPSSMDASSSLLAAQNSTVGQFNGHNGTAIKAEAGYSSNSDFGFGNENVFLEQSVGDVSGGSFSSSELNGQQLGDPILDMDSSSYGFLSQIPRNFSFSDLTEDFSQSAGAFM